MALPTLSTYAVGAGQPIHGGRWPGGRLTGTALLSPVVASGSLEGASPPPPVPVGQWQLLSVAPHSRKTSNLGPGVGTVPTFDPTKSIALDNAAPTSNVNRLPAKGWNQLVQGERGYWYLCGGLHSNYPGQEVDRVSLPTGADTTMVTELDVQPFRPPEGPFSGYFSGGSGYYHRQYNVPMADPTDWRPYPGHQWTMATWHPDWGYLVRVPYPIQASYPDGAFVFDGSVMRCSHAQHTDPSPPPDLADYITGYAGLDWTTKKWRTYIPNLNTDYGGIQEDGWVGQTGASDWNEFSNSLMFLATGVAGRTHLRAWHRSTNTVQNLGFTETIGGQSGTGGNGVRIQHLEGEKYLILRVNPDVTPPSAAHRLVLFNRRAGSGESRFFPLTIPAVAFTGAANNQDAVAFVVDKNGRRIFWLVRPGGTQPLRFYRSTFDDPVTWTELTITPSISSATVFIDPWKAPMMFHDGYLYLQDTTTAVDPYGWPDGQITMRRAKVDAGEDLPAMTFTRYDYDSQNFGFSAAPSVLGMRSVKHANLACRVTTGEHFVCAGDLGGTFNSSMAKLTFSGTGPTQYLWTETLSETQPAPLDGATRMRRPVSPDDGAWWYSDSSNPNPAFRDKFIFMRGGDGTGWASNPYTRAAYRKPAYTAEIAAWDADANVEVNCPLHIADMQADGWTVERLLVFDPAKNGFISTGVNAWPVSSGSWTVPHPTASLSGASSRCGAFDVATNCAFRITNVSGTPALVRYDLTNQTIRVWNIGVWVDAAGVMGPAGRQWFLNGQDPGALPVTANGFGFQDPGDANRWKTAYPGHWEHKALWIDSRDGKLYGVSPQTGYLWCFETRGAETSTADGLVIPFYPVGNRVPLVGTYPALVSLRNWPPVQPTGDFRGNGDAAMNSFLVPFKGGLLWWSSAHHDQGSFGRPLYAFWRRLGFTGDWSVVSMPRELSANAYSMRTTGWDNDEVVMLAGGGHSEEASEPGNGAAGIPLPRQKYFWRLS